MKNTLSLIEHHEDWKDRRRTFDQAFTKRLDEMLRAIGTLYFINLNSVLWYDQYYFTAIFVVWCQFMTVLWRETWLNHWEQRQMGQWVSSWRMNFPEFHSKWSVRWHEVFSPCVRLLLSLTSSQVAFGAEFERDPFVQSQAGKKGLTSLVTDVWKGVELVNVYPFVKVMDCGLDCEVDCVFTLFFWTVPAICG